MDLEHEVVAAIRRITDRFIRLGKPTPVHEIKSKLGAKRRVLDRLIQERVIQYTGEGYVPCLRGVTEFEDPSLQKLCFGWTETVLKALKSIYEHEGDKDCTSEEVADTVTRIMEIPTAPEVLRVGLLFVKEFPDYFGSWVTDGVGAVKSIRVTDAILDFDTFASAWQKELDRRNSLAEHTTLAARVPTRVDDPADLDSVLGLYNRRRFDRDLRELLSRATADVPLGMIMIDLDGFKQINDVRGHSEGDEVLKLVASYVKTSCSGKGSCYRWGGDEFVILLANYSVGEATALGERIRSGIERAASRWPLTASVGVACFPDTTEKQEQLLEDADLAMYAAKKAGGNRVRAADPPPV